MMFDFFRKLGNGKYRVMFKAEPFDLCQITSKRGGMKNQIFKMMFDSINVYAPGFFHDCPYIGLHKALNWTYSRPFITFFPIGTYRALGTITDGKNVLFKTALDFRML
jgi:hypothetical protein